MIKHTIATLALTLSLASSAVQAQETNCDDWVASDKEVRKMFWEAATAETVADCLNSGSSVNARDKKGFTPLQDAAFLNNTPEVLTVLLNAGADVNARDEEGSTPLHRAAVNKNSEVLTVLLEAGADVNAKNEDGFTPLHIAASSNDNPDVLALLLNSGADGAAINDFGQTPFEAAKNNEALAGTDAYWALNDARYK